MANQKKIKAEDLDVTTAGIPSSLNKRYVTDANLTLLANTSGTNTGDQDLSALALKASPTFTGTVVLPADTSIGNVSAAEIAFLDGVTSNIQAQINAKSSITGGGVNILPKYGSTTSIVPSRITDTGTYIGIGTVNAPTKDITLGNQSDKEIGIEESSNTIIGRNFTIKSGRTINYVPNVNFNSLNLVYREYNTFYKYGSDIYAAADNSNTIFKQTNGTGEFLPVGSFAGSQGWRFIIDGSGNFYYGNWNTTILHKQSSVSGSATVEATFTARINALALTPSNDLYVFTGDKTYVQTNLTGAFNDIGQALPQGGGNRDNACASPSGNIYASMGGSLYKRTGGTGSFVNLNLPFSTITVYVSPNNNVYVSGNNQIYMQTNETGAFVSLGQTSRAYNILGEGLNGNVLALVWGDGIYLQNNDVVGASNLNGGVLKLVSGTGKGTGDSNFEVYTGQKLPSGTDMQAETLRAKINNEGLMTLPSTTNAIIAADATGKAVVTKEYLQVATLPSGPTAKIYSAGELQIFKVAPNVDPAAIEIGDYCIGFVEGQFINANYLGGSIALLASFNY